MIDMMTVIVYTSPTCGPCLMVKKWLQANNIQYAEKQGAQHIDEIQKLTGKTQVPVVIAGDQILTGFNPTKLKEALGF